MSDDTVFIDTKKLDAIIKALKVQPPVARVGILGKKAQRADLGGETNAAIGARHEFGDEKMPIRSFLRVPITDLLQKELDKSQAFTPEVLKKIIDQKSLFEWVRNVAICAENVVLGAFDSGGYGKWKPSNMKYKKVHQTLVETQQLRNSITSEVK